MGKPDQEDGKSGRKRQLNVIYFIDSARTRSITIPLGRLNVMLVVLFGMLTWSVASIFLIGWMLKGEDELAGQLRSALATVFEYETKYDGVYDVAYPSSDKAQTPKPMTVAQAIPQEPAPKAETAPAKAEVSNPSAFDEPGSADEGGAKTAEAKAPEAAAAKEAAPSSPPASATPATSAEAGAEDTGVTVGNPVLEAGDKSLELRFDLTSKSNQDRAEGYVWAIAEFTAEDGSKTYLGAPSSIQVNDKGEPAYPYRSAIFGIKRFKKKIFSFPLLKDKSGTITGVRIGVMDRNGANKTTYNVPVAIKVGKGSTTGAGSEGAGGPQSG